ncbi:DUF2631 domain-containing protein [Pseudonocardia acaciae]|uniref:DUF2631 domain-containing protein n=1 Tax=Pseudonocardia acaciae TaxID=551276 RepID=UPI0006871776|nr:DUF2631 domain-containing protein [Pseudonocardia acaciae]
MTGTGQELARRNGRPPAKVDPEDEPSAEWGWHGGFPRGMIIAGWLSTIIMLLMLFGNHQGRVEDVWLVAVAVLMAGGLIRYSLKRRHSWRR